MADTAATLLKRYERVKLCTVDWQTALGAHYPTLKPFLTPAIGEITTTYPAPISGIRMDVDVRGDRYIAYSTGESTCDEDLTLAVDDVQLWQFDLNRAASFTGSSVATPDEPKTIARVIGSFQTIILSSGRKMALGSKHKRKAFLRAVVKWCRDNATDEFYAQDVIEDYNAAFPDQDSPKRIRTDRVVDDLFKGQKDEFNELFETLDLTAGHFRMKVLFKNATK